LQLPSISRFSSIFFFFFFFFFINLALLRSAVQIEIKEDGWLKIICLKKQNPVLEGLNLLLYRLHLVSRAIFLLSLIFIEEKQL